MNSLRPEPWAVHLCGLLAPSMALTGNLLGGPWTLLGFVFVLGCGPLLDLALGESPRPRPPRESGLPFEVLLWLRALAHFIVLASFFRFAMLEGTVTPWLIAAAISTGLCASDTAIVTAHELGHRRPHSAAWYMARCLLFSIHYPHFTTEHNHRHHRWVATARDAASADAGTNLWSFWARTIPAQFFSAVDVHRQKGRHGLRNPVYRGLLLQVTALLALALVPGPLVLGWLILSLTAILLLEYVNYIRHWGLRRPEDSRFEAAHAWNTEARWSRWTLLELTRHSDHHLHASVPFWKLRPHPDAPTLPGGYYACWWPCLVPPLWRWWMRRTRQCQAMRS